ncbi:hypothetical protein D3C87_687290 [compost metagenome]
MATSFERFVQGYLECAAWASHDGEHEGLESFEFAPSAILQAHDDCREFIAACGPLIEQATQYREWGELGHDFFLCSRGHGTGFFDRNMLKDVEPCATVYGVERWEGACYSTDDTCGHGRGSDSLGDVLSAIAYGTHRAISRFSAEGCYLGDDQHIYFL